MKGNLGSDTDVKTNRKEHFVCELERGFTDDLFDSLAYLINPLTFFNPERVWIFWGMLHTRSHQSVVKYFCEYFIDMEVNSCISCMQSISFPAAYSHCEKLYSCDDLVYKQLLYQLYLVLQVLHLLLESLIFVVVQSTEGIGYLFQIIIYRALILSIFYAHIHWSKHKRKVSGIVVVVYTNKAT